jgi:hypothetical protein
VDEPLGFKKGMVSSVTFAPDGTTIAAACNIDGGVGGVVLFDVNFSSWQRIAGGIANRNFTGEEWRQYFHEEPYHRTFRKLPWPSDLPEEARVLAKHKVAKPPDPENEPTQ